MKPIVAVMVLYRMPLSESPTYKTFSQAVALSPKFGKAFRLYVADNSPEAQAVPADFVGEYAHDGTNPGLAKRYNEGLARATAEGSDWLLTLDQDTTLTLPYLQELLALAEELAAKSKVVAIVPKLAMRGRLYSPHTPRYRRSKYIVDFQSTGIAGDTLRAFNSASLLRVSALNAIGGYSLKYWLDFLDHATFAALQQDGRVVYIMRSILEHDLSEANPENTGRARAENILQAEQQFYLQYGTPKDRFWRWLDLLRQVIGHGRRGRFELANRRLRFLLGRR